MMRQLSPCASLGAALLASGLRPSRRPRFCTGPDRHSVEQSRTNFPKPAIELTGYRAQAKEAEYGEERQP
jgi:hypothetical protein